MNESWKLKKALASGISTSRIDEIYDAAVEAGALGGKLLGAGGGGFMMFMVPEHRKAAVRERLKDLVNVRFRFETGGSKVLYAERDGWDNGEA